MNVPQSTLSGDVVSIVNLHDRTNGKHIAELVLRYKVLGNIAVATERVFLEVDKSSPIKSVKVPVHISEPVTFDDLKLSVSRNLRDIPMELVRDGDSLSILITASYQSLDGGDIGGEVRVESKMSGNGAGFYLMLKRSSVIRLSPASLQFRRQKSDDSIQVATALMRISQPQVEDLDDSEPDKPSNEHASKEEPRISKPQVTLHFGSEKLFAEVVPIGKSGVFKIIVRIKVHGQPPLTDKLVWKINWKDEVLETAADAFFKISTKPLRLIAVNCQVNKWPWIMASDRVKISLLTTSLLLFKRRLLRVLLCLCYVPDMSYSQDCMANFER